MTCHTFRGLSFFLLEVRIGVVLDFPPVVCVLAIGRRSSLPSFWSLGMLLPKDSRRIMHSPVHIAIGNDEQEVRTLGRQIERSFAVVQCRDPNSGDDVLHFSPPAQGPGA